MEDPKKQNFGITCVVRSYRVVRRRRDDGDGLVPARRRAERVHGGLVQLGGAGADHEVVPIDHGVSDDAVESAHLALQLWLEEPAERGGVGEVAHHLPAADHGGPAVPDLPPERLVHRRVATAGHASQA